MHRILIDKNLCEGCKTCVLACMMRNTKAENLYTIDLNSIDTVSYTHLDVYKRQEQTQLWEWYVLI